MERILDALDELVRGMNDSEKMFINNLYEAEMTWIDIEPHISDRLGWRVLALTSSMDDLDPQDSTFLHQFFTDNRDEFEYIQHFYNETFSIPEVEPEEEIAVYHEEDEEIAVDDEEDVHWEDQFSLSDHSSDSGYAGSSSSFSNISEFSSYTDELRHNEQSHFGFLVTPGLLREPIHIQSVADVPSTPTRMKETDIISWLKDTEFQTQKLSERKRKHDDEGEEFTDACKYTTDEPDTKRRKLYARKSTSLHNVQCTYTRNQTPSRQSSSDSCLINETI